MLTLSAHLDCHRAREQGRGDLARQVRTGTDPRQGWGGSATTSLAICLSSLTWQKRGGGVFRRIIMRHVTSIQENIGSLGSNRIARIGVGPLHFFTKYFWPVL